MAGFTRPTIFRALRAGMSDREGQSGDASAKAGDGAFVSLRRAMIAALLGFALVAMLRPDTWAPLLAGFVLLTGVMLTSRRNLRRQRPGEDGRRRLGQLWPDAGTKAVVDAMLEPAFVIDRNLSLRFRNQSSERVFGSMALGDPISLRFRSPELLAAVETCLRQHCAGTASFAEGRAADRFWAVDVLPIPVPQGENPSFFLLLFRDRTGERRIEQMRTDFVANASHELRTPLAALMGFIETLQGPARDDAAARARFLAIMRDQAARMSRLIDDLLSLSRIEMKRHVAVEGSVDLCRILLEVREALSPLAADFGVVIETEFEAGAHVVEGERDELVQVFANLVENACKYGDTGKRVVVQLKRVRERGTSFVDASVKDFGPGIASEHVPRLTERFYRVDIASSRAKRGTGLGLSIVRNILLRHRARLIVSSELGLGSTFTARFPIRSDSPS